MGEILEQIKELREIIEKQQNQILYQQEQIQQCRMILNNINVINLDKLRKFLLESR